MWRHGLALCATLLMLAGTTAARAHDFWIEPTGFTPEAGQVVGLRLRVGEHLRGEPVTLSPGLVKQFDVADAQQRRPVVVRGGADPAGAIRIVRPGLQIVSYFNDPNRVELPADKFNAYLAAEGLDHIIELRTRRNESEAPARELYARCAKSLLWAGPVGAGEADRRLGLPLELVLERDPSAIDAGEALPVRLIFEGRPLAGALVVAINSLEPMRRHAARTDHAGRVQLRLPPSRGLWLVKAVHMVEAPADADAQWMSWWASLTFGRRGEP